MNKVKANDVKKGWQIQLDDGTVGEMNDNRKGMSRSMLLPMLHDPSVMDSGAMYVYRVKLARPSPEEDWMEVELTGAQKNQARKIREMNELF